jgi:2-methylisocitrate lyase-like PEP mutase family enzyme
MCCSSGAPRASSWGGADCLYAPGIQSPEHIRRVVEAVHPKPVNVLVMAPTTQSLWQLGELGVRRVSVGGALARAAWGGFMHAAREIAEQGRFDALANAASGRSLNALFDQPGG